MNLTNEDVADLLALLDSLPYDELDLQTTSFRLTLRRTPDGWTQSAQVLTAPDPLEPASPEPRTTASMSHRGGYNRTDVTSLRPEEGDARTDEQAHEVGGTSEVDGELVGVRTPLPGTFYRAPRPGAAPFVEVGSRVAADTVVAIVETMKLMNSVHAGADGTVAEICLRNAEFAAQGQTLMRIEVDG